MHVWVGVLSEFVHLLGCLTKTGHKTSGTSYKVKGVLAEGEPEVENNKEVMKEKVQTAKCFKVSAFCTELVPPDS